MSVENKSNRAIAIWLLVVCALIFSMVVLGGVTRLTRSGLSMVDWNPIMGVVPPLSTEQWQKTFDRYQQFPEYKKVNEGMTLSQFKSIFWFEYIACWAAPSAWPFWFPFLSFWCGGRSRAR